MSITLILKDTTKLIYRTETPITATKLLFELLYYGNNYDADNFEMIRYTGLFSTTKNLTNNMIKELYLKNYELFLYETEENRNIRHNPLTYENTNVILDSEITYYVDGNMINRRRCIATLVSGDRCGASCMDDNICCIEHLRRNPTINDIKMNYYEIKRELTNEYLESKMDMHILINRLMDAKLDDPISLLTITPNILKTWVFNNINVFFDSKNNNDMVHIDICNTIKKCIYSMAYSIIHSPDYSPILCNRIKPVSKMPRKTVEGTYTHNKCAKCNDIFPKNNLIHIDNMYLCTKKCLDDYINRDRECCTCMDTFKITELIVCKCSKSHYFCHECIVNYIKSKHNDGLSYNHCPMDSNPTDNKKHIDLRPIYRHLEPDMIKNIGINARIDLYSKASARNINFYVCPFCKIYGVDIDKPIMNNISYTTKIKHNKGSFIELKFIDGYVYPFIVKSADNMIDINDMWCAQFKSTERTFDLSQPSLVEEETIRTCGLSSTHMLVSIDDIDIAGFMEKEIMEMLNKDCVIETKHEQICEILTSIDKTNTIKTKNKITVIHCEECDKDWCINCNKKSHNGTCETIENPEDIPRRVAEIVTDVMIDKCPNCNYAYVKSEGCNLIHCGKCPQAFCHLCKLKIEKRNGREYWHFKGSGSENASSTCPLYECDNSDSIKMRHISTNIKITNLINSNMQYRNIIISELAKHNIIITAQSRSNIFKSFFKSMFSPFFKKTPPQQVNNVNDIDLGDNIIMLNARQERLIGI